MAGQDTPDATRSDDEVAGDRARKAALRRAVRVARDELAPLERVTAAGAAVERLRQLPELRGVRVAALYTAHGNELDVAGLADELRARGVTTGLPRVHGDELELVATTAAAALAAGYRGIREPAGPGLHLDTVEVVVLPGTAFDPVGGRLGRGGGHYDRLLARLPATTVRIGVGFACQLVPRVPREAHDEPVDLVVTDRVVHRTGARG